MRLAILRALTWVVLRLRVYYGWSRIYRWLWERKYKGVILPTFSTMLALESAVKEMVWREDSWLQLWDAVSSPRAVWGKHLSGELEGDCDDISVFACDALERCQTEVMVGRVRLLSVPWLKDGKAGGHNVCAFEYKVPGRDAPLWAWVSNWYEGKVQWGMTSLAKVAGFVLGGAGLGAESLGWADASADLKESCWHSWRDIESP